MDALAAAAAASSEDDDEPAAADASGTSTALRLIEWGGAQSRPIDPAFFRMVHNSLVENSAEMLDASVRSFRYVDFPSELCFHRTKRVRTGEFETALRCDDDAPFVSEDDVGKVYAVTTEEDEAYGETSYFVLEHAADGIYTGRWLYTDTQISRLANVGTTSSRPAFDYGDTDHDAERFKLHARLIEDNNVLLWRSSFRQSIADPYSWTDVTARVRWTIPVTPGTSGKCLVVGIVDQDTGAVGWHEQLTKRRIDTAIDTLKPADTPLLDWTDLCHRADAWTFQMGKAGETGKCTVCRRHQPLSTTVCMNGAGNAAITVKVGSTCGRRLKLIHQLSKAARTRELSVINALIDEAARIAPVH